MAAIINQAPRECRAARIKAGGRKEFIYPDDFRISESMAATSMPGRRTASGTLRPR